MIALLHGYRASLDHRAGPELAALDVPAGTLIDRENDRARIPGDPAGWISGGGLLLHARTGLMGVVALRDEGASRPPVTWPSRGPSQRPKLRHSLPRDLVSCLRCERLVLVARDPGDPAETWLVEPSRWILASIDVAIAFPYAPAPSARRPGRYPRRAGEPHRCLALFGG